jgi:hypothetical protein
VGRHEGRGCGTAGIWVMEVAPIAPRTRPWPSFAARCWTVPLWNAASQTVHCYFLAYWLNFGHWDKFVDLKNNTNWLPTRLQNSVPDVDSCSHFAYSLTRSDICALMYQSWLRLQSRSCYFCFDLAKFKNGNKNLQESIDRRPQTSSQKPSTSNSKHLPPTSSTP